tara:strand:- start:57 stop:467 length:411 start_codon:yes stop_codon:yes gene_type:complete
MKWEDILKKTATNSDFIIFLVSVFNISREDASNIKASKGLKQAISNGTFLNYITEEEFDTLMKFAQAKRYEKLVKFLEELHSKWSRVRADERSKEYQKRPEVIERRKRPEVIERKRKYDQRHPRSERRRRKDKSKE